MMKDLAVGFAAVLIVTGVCFALATNRTFNPIDSQAWAYESAPSPDAGATVAPGGKVIMHVNGEPVTDQEFHAFISTLPEQMQQYVVTPEGRKLVAGEMAKLKLMEQEGRRLGAAKDPLVASRLALARAEVMAQFGLEKSTSGDEARLRAEYEKEKGNLGTVELSHILVAFAGGQVPARSGSAPPPQEAMRKARGIYEKLRAGASFEELARTESDDVGSGRNGGALGPIPHDRLPPNIAQAVFQLQPGQITVPLESNFGIHIFKVGKKATLPYEQVRESLAQKMKAQLVADAVAKLTKNAKIDYDPQFFGPPAAGPAAKAGT